MHLYNRRLLLLIKDEPTSTDASSPPGLMAAASSSSSLLARPLKLPPPPAFSSHLAYAVLILISLLGSLCLFNRWFAEDSPTSRRHSSSASSNHSSPSASCDGLDQTTVQSLPVFAYDGEAKHQEDCAICLSEFENGEAVKMIPNCKHVFHPECIDTWLFSHVTCPICRGTRFLPVERHAGMGKVEQNSDRVVRSHQGGSTVENGETWVEGRVMGTRNQRSSSCSSFRDIVVLRRTFSY